MATNSICHLGLEQLTIPLQSSPAEIKISIKISLIATALTYNLDERPIKKAHVESKENNKEQVRELPLYRSR